MSSSTIGGCRTETYSSRTPSINASIFDGSPLKSEISYDANINPSNGDVSLYQGGETASFNGNIYPEMRVNQDSMDAQSLQLQNFNKTSKHITVAAGKRRPGSSQSYTNRSNGWDTMSKGNNNIWF